MSFWWKENAPHFCDCQRWTFRANRKAPHVHFSNVWNSTFCTWNIRWGKKWVEKFVRQRESFRTNEWLSNKYAKSLIIKANNGKSPSRKSISCWTKIVDLEREKLLTFVYCGLTLQMWYSFAMMILPPSPATQQIPLRNRIHVRLFFFSFRFLIFSVLSQINIF